MWAVRHENVHGNPQTGKEVSLENEKIPNQGMEIFHPELGYRNVPREVVSEQGFIYTEINIL